MSGYPALTQAQWVILVALVDSGGSARKWELHEVVGRPQGGVTRSLWSLARFGYIETARPHDPRYDVTVVEITIGGRERHADGPPDDRERERTLELSGRISVTADADSISTRERAHNVCTCPRAFAHDPVAFDNVAWLRDGCRIHNDLVDDRRAGTESVRIILARHPVVE